MNTDLSTTIRCIDGQIREFHFTRINSTAIYYHISVVDDNGRLLTGTLARNEMNDWKLRELELPAWFIAAESQFTITVEGIAAS
jgi:hypothetical protein